MARKYNHVIRFFESWFVDLESPEKEFTDAEKWQIVKAIYDCQINTSLEPLQALPLSVRRALSMATLGEQITAILERADSYRKRGSWARAKAPEGDSPRAKIQAEEREQEQAARKQKQATETENLKAEMAEWGVTTPMELYKAQLFAARNGDKAMRKKFPNWRELYEKNFLGTSAH